jgi:membrane protease YdiL (CAAX protease family)
VEDQLRSLVALGLTLILVMLRAEAQRFGTAEYDELFLNGGNGGVGLGFALGAVGVAYAVAMAWLRYRYVRLPDLSQYPGALINEIGTAVFDETVFRAALLGFLIAGGVEPTLAVVTQTAIYALATRLGAPGRSRSMFILALVIGAVGGWATITTGGIAAAILGHGITRVAIFLTTGHAGQPLPKGREIEEVERRRRAPDGWRVVAGRDARGER